MNIFRCQSKKSYVSPPPLYHTLTNSKPNFRYVIIPFLLTTTPLRLDRVYMSYLIYMAFNMSWVMVFLTLSLMSEASLTEVQSHSYRTSPVLGRGCNIHPIYTKKNCSQEMKNIKGNNSFWMVFLENLCEFE